MNDHNCCTQLFEDRCLKGLNSVLLLVNEEVRAKAECKTKGQATKIHWVTKRTKPLPSSSSERIHKLTERTDVSVDPKSLINSHNASSESPSLDLCMAKKNMNQLL